jgi:hypothetical protein
MSKRTIKLKIKLKILAKMEIRAIPLAVAGANPVVDRLPMTRKQTLLTLTADLRAQPEMADRKFFV